MTSAPYIVTPPATRLLNKQDVKNHCNIDHGADDTLIDSYIDAATSYLDGLDGIMGRALVTQTWGRRLSYFPSEIRLPIGPVSSIGSLTYYDANDTQQTLAPATYELRADHRGAYATLAWGQSWPNFTARPDGIVIQWVAGTAVASVPQAIKMAMLLMIGGWYENRESIVIGTVLSGEMPFAVTALLAPFRRFDTYRFGDYEEACSCH